MGSSRLITFSRETGSPDDLVNIFSPRDQQIIAMRRADFGGVVRIEQQTNPCKILSCQISTD
jgi:hypothetical protein